MNDSLNLNPSLLAWLIAGFLFFFGLSALHYIRQTLRKREALRELARQMGFGYFVLVTDLTRAGYDLPEPLAPRQAHSPLIHLGLGPGSQNILRGEKNGWTIFYLETPAPERDRTLETLALFLNPGADLPYFELVPLRLFDKFHRLLELDIRDLVSGPGVSRLEIKGLADFHRPKHHLWGETRRASDFASIFSREFLEFLGGQPNWRIQARGDWVMIFEENFAIPPEALGEFASRTQRAMELFFSGLKDSRARVPVEAGKGLASGPLDGGGSGVGEPGSKHRTLGGSVRETPLNGQRPAP